MKIYVTEKPIAHKKWTIEIHTDRFGNKFVCARRETIYGTMLEIRVEEYDGFHIPREKNNQLIDMEELFQVKNEMMKVFRNNNENERRRSYVRY